MSSKVPDPNGTPRPDKSSVSAGLAPAAPGVVAPSIPDHELLCWIGAGSYGEVWLARNIMGSLRAVKIIRRQSFDHEQPFLREFNGIQKAEPISRRHEALVDILQVGRNDAGGYFYYVMELADPAEPSVGEIGQGAANEERTTGNGRQASEPSQDNRRSATAGSNVRGYVPRTLRYELDARGRLPVADCVRIALAVTGALETLHRAGLVHRDVKPSNIVFVDGFPKLADIGLVAEVSEARSFVGTPGYIPPEGPGTPQADIYSLGRVLYEMCTGRDRHDFPELPADLRELPDREGILELNEIIMKACAANPRQRHRSAAELRDDLALVEAGRSVRRLRTMERRLVWVSKAGAVITALLVVAAGLYLMAARQAKDTGRRLYVADMGRALHAWESGNVVRARELLDEHRRRQPEMLGFEWRLIDELCRESDAPRTLRGHDRPIECVALSPDGALVATGGRDRRVCLWETASGRLRRQFETHTGIVHAIAFSPDGRWLASGGRDDAVRLTEVESARERFVLRGHQDAIRAVAFMPDGGSLLSGAEDRTIRTWDLATGIERQDQRITDDFKVEKMALSPDGLLLATCGFSTKVRRWRLPGRERLADLNLHQASAADVCFSPDAHLLASGGYDGPVQLWDLMNERAFGQLGRGAPVRALIFSPDGFSLATATRDSQIHVWDLRTRLETATLRGHQDEVSSLEFSRDGRLLVSGSDDRTARLWSLNQPASAQAQLVHRGIVNSLAFSADGQKLVTGDANQSLLRIWDPVRGAELTNYSAPPGGIWSVAMSADGRTIATGGAGADTQLRLWDLAGREPPVVLSGHEGGIESVAFSPDGRTVATASRDETLRLWDVRGRRPKPSPPGRHGMLRSVTFSPDNRRVAASSRDGNVRLWLADSPGNAVVLKGQGTDAWAVAFAPDGRTLASGSGSRILLWDLSTRRLKATFEGHAAAVSSLAFSADGQTLASGSWDSTVRLWHLPLREEVASLQGHSGQVRQVAFSPAGNLLASASADGTVHLWRASPPSGNASGPPRKE